MEVRDDRGQPLPPAKPVTRRDDPRLTRVLRSIVPASEERAWLVAVAAGSGAFVVGLVGFVVATDAWFDARGASKFAPFPYAAVVGLACGWAGWWAARRFDLGGAIRRERRGLVKAGRCGNCRYELIGAPEDDGCRVCSECGAAWRLPAENASPPKPPTRRWGA